MPIHNVEDTLPDQPSALLRLALADLRAVEADGRYVVDMQSWHAPREPRLGDGQTKCRVCLAGAVMAREFSLDPKYDRLPGHMPRGVEAKLYALDCFRKGIVGLGLHRLGHLATWTGPHNRGMRAYRQEGFWEDMEQLAADLEGAGL